MMTMMALLLYIRRTFSSRRSLHKSCVTHKRHSRAETRYSFCTVPCGLQHEYCTASSFPPSRHLSLPRFFARASIRHRLREELAAAAAAAAEQHGNTLELFLLPLTQRPRFGICRGRSKRQRFADKHPLPTRSTHTVEASHASPNRSSWRADGA